MMKKWLTWTLYQEKRKRKNSVVDFGSFPNQVALLDYGQVKDLPDALRLGYANLILAIADKDPKRASESYRY